MVKIGDTIRVKVYEGKADKQTQERRIIGRDSESGKIILFDRNNERTKSLQPGDYTNCNITQETATFFVADIIDVEPGIGRVFTTTATPPQQFPEEKKPVQAKPISELTHLFSFYTKLEYKIGVGYFIPLEESVLKDKVEWGNDTLRVEVWRAN